MTTTSKNPETLVLHSGPRSDSATGAVATPIYQTTSYQFRSTEHAASLFALKEFGNVYSRIMNPTNDALEQKVAALEGGVAALAVSSGQAASAMALQNICRPGDNWSARPTSTAARGIFSPTPCPRWASLCASLIRQTLKPSAGLPMRAHVHTMPKHYPTHG